MSIKHRSCEDILEGLFEIDVILDEYQTKEKGYNEALKFEIDVILDEYQTKDGLILL